MVEVSDAYKKGAEREVSSAYKKELFGHCYVSRGSRLPLDRGKKFLRLIKKEYLGA